MAELSTSQGLVQAVTEVFPGQRKAHDHSKPRVQTSHRLRAEGITRFGHDREPVVDLGETYPDHYPWGTWWPLRELAQNIFPTGWGHGD